MREPERAVVHGNHPARFQVEERLSCVGRIGVNVTKLLRIVGADRKQCDVGSEASSDFRESLEVCGVASVIERVRAALKHESAITSVRILQDARAPVTRRDVRHREIAVARSVPPVKLDDLGKAEVRYQVRNVRRDDDRRSNAALAQVILHEGAKRRTMEMVEMRMRYEYQVDRR